jgi:hypothetical protein
VEHFGAGSGTEGVEALTQSGSSSSVSWPQGTPSQRRGGGPSGSEGSSCTFPNSHRRHALSDP